MRVKGKAKIIFECKTREDAEKIAELLEIDNKLAPKEVVIRTFSHGRRVITEIKTNEFKKLLSTIDDLIFSERVINKILKI